LDPSIASIDRKTGSTGTWTEVKGSKLKNAVQMHGDKDSAGISARVSGRTKNHCRSRWHDALNPSSTLMAGRTGKWTADEDDKLEDSVQMHGGKDWAGIAALVPGRVESQCRSRWQSLRRNPEQ
jgi:hypothetical protein